MKRIAVATVVVCGLLSVGPGAGAQSLPPPAGQLGSDVYQQLAAIKTQVKELQKRLRQNLAQIQALQNQQQVLQAMMDSLVAERKRIAQEIASTSPVLPNKNSNPAYAVLLDSLNRNQHQIDATKANLTAIAQGQRSLQAQAETVQKSINALQTQGRELCHLVKSTEQKSCASAFG